MKTKRLKERLQIVIISAGAAAVVLGLILSAAGVIY